MPEPFALTIPYPPLELSLNGRIHWRARAPLVRDYVNAVAALCRARIPEESRPYFAPAEAPFVRVDVRVQRHPGGQRRDFGGVIEALKAALDGTEGLVVANDRAYYYGRPIEWDERPSGEGQITLTLTGKTRVEALAD